VEGVDELGEIAANEDNVGAFAGNIGARAHGDADGGLHQCGRIVDTVANHGHFVALFRELLHVLQFIFGEKFGGDFVDGQFLADIFRGGSGIAGEENGAKAHGFQRLDGVLGFGAGGVGNVESAQETASASDEDFGSN
jgi:hypothetical protein